jgi:DNA-binding response OmpR family regulator
VLPDSCVAWLRRIAVIALSTSLNVSQREHGHGIGVSDRLAKPVRFEALQACWRAVCWAQTRVKAPVIRRYFFKCRDDA